MHVVPRQVNTTHPFSSHLNHPCIHSLQFSVSLSALSILFSLVPGGRCMGNSLACRMFSCSCTVWVSLPPPSPRSLQFFLSFSESIAIFLLSLSLSLSPRPNTRLVLVTLIICSPSFLLLVRHNIPLRALHMFELLPPIPSDLSRLVSHLPFHNRSTQLCIFLAILFLQFYCTTVLFIPPHHTQSPSRCPYITCGN